MKSNLTKSLCLGLLAFQMISCGNSSEEKKSQEMDLANEELEQEIPDEIEKEYAEIESEIENMEFEVENNSDKSEEIDEALDSYEAYVDEYIVFLKKANEGDMTALQRYPQLMQKANDMNSKIQGMNNQLSPKQFARLSDIVNKMNQAAMNLQS